MKYKVLTGEELEKLTSEFVHFLVVNGITADDWVKIKEESPVKANKFIESFSDVVYEGWMRKIQYLEVILPNEIMCFYCQPNQMVLVGLTTTDKEYDFTTMNDLKNLPKDDSFEIYTQTKAYSKQREVELFEMVERGAIPADASLFNALCLAL